MSMNNYYPRLRDLREDRDMTQEQIAAYLGMKQAQYSLSLIHISEPTRP